MSTVSIQKTVNITPSVIEAGGSGLVLSGMLVTENWRIPIGTAIYLSSAAAVANYFGDETVEARAAAKYFSGFIGSNKKPARMGFTQYNTEDVGAYVLGGSLSSMTLAELQAISGALSIVLDGVTKSGTPDLSGATSFSNAAQLLGDSLGVYGPQSASFTGEISTTTLTASSVTGEIVVGGKLLGSGITSGTYIVSQLTGIAGGAGTYQVSDSQTVGSEAMTSTLPGFTYDSVSGGFKVISPTVGDDSSAAYATGAISDDLKLTLTTGAILSQGDDAQTSPQAFMTALVQETTAFASFALAFNPDAPDENGVRLDFAEWTGDQNNRYAYEATDSDESPTVSASATSSLGQLIIEEGISGVTVNWRPEPDDELDYANLAAFAMGIAASIDFTQRNGRVTFDFRRQSGMEVGVDDDTVHDNLLANGYNFYQVEANGEEEWRSYCNGSISGEFLWADSYFNQIAMNGSFTNALRNLLQNAFSVPYNAAGRALIEGALLGPIEQFLDFGAYRAGVALSSQQIADVNNRAGKDIASTLTNQGWYLDIGVASAEVRQARGTPPMTFYYVDGQTVQRFEMASISLL